MQSTRKITEKFWKLGTAQFGLVKPLTLTTAFAAKMVVMSGRAPARHRAVVPAAKSYAGMARSKTSTTASWLS
jgi:hypothetical protein